MITAIGLGLGGALFVATAFVLQQHVAAQEPPSLQLRQSLLGRLLRRPQWLAGLAFMVLGQVLGAAALGHAGVALVQPVMSVNLLFALGLSAAWYRQRLGRREWAGAVLLLAGLAAFIGAGQPHGGSSQHLPWPNWAISGGTIVAIAAGLVTASRHRRPATTATLLATAAGVLYGLQDALTQRTISGLGGGLVAVLTSWPPFTLLAVGAVALLVAQSAFEAAPLGASLPAITVAEPLTAIAFGTGVYGEQIDLHSAMLVVELLGLCAMCVGVVLVAASPLVVRRAEVKAAQISGEPAGHEERALSRQGNR